ncbi:MAG: guanylate kinase [Desulfobulbus propionicus]|nr:MAG: guanylate kinase [Desulfobulbus propionicus]
MNNGALFVMSAPSGCGKTTLIQKIMADTPGLVFSTSHTTRAPRAGEREGTDYYFVDDDTFLGLRDQESGGFLEWAEVYGNYYGTSKAEVARLLATGRDVILDIDVQGAGQVMRCAAPVTIFIAPPSLEELERRLRGRGTDDDATLSLRLAHAREEFQLASTYDYLVINDNLDEAQEVLQSIIVAERCKRRRHKNGVSITLPVP